MKKHGMSKTKLYRSWSGMKQRCLNKKDTEYLNYGGRGTFICVFHPRIRRGRAGRERMIGSEWAKKQREQIDWYDAAICSCGLEHRHVAKVRCSCGKLIHVKDAYRCYYCDKYFCEVCAPEHFGMTREQYEAGKVAAQEGDKP